MKKILAVGLVLIAAVLFAVSTPAALAARAETVEPTSLLSLDRTAGATSISPSGSCNDTRSTVFYDTNPQVCVNHCASNGWTFVDSIDRRYYQICICCAD